MRRAISTLVYARRERLHPGLLDQMVAGGAEAIEIFAARGHFNYSDRKHVREIGNWFRSTGITFHSMHAPMHGDDEFGRSGAPPLNIAAVEKRDRIAAMDEIKRAIEVAEQAPFQFLVQHVGVGGETSTGQKLETAMTSLEHLRAFAKPLGVQVVVENIPN
jgi:sugar phosphate isomerase/epimerase